MLVNYEKRREGNEREGEIEDPLELICMSKLINIQNSVNIPTATFGG